MVFDFPLVAWGWEEWEEWEEGVLGGPRDLVRCGREGEEWQERRAGWEEWEERGWEEWGEGNGKGNKRKGRNGESLRYEY